MQTLADRIAREGALPALDAAGWVIRVARRVESLHGLGVTHGAISADCLTIEGTSATSRGVFMDARRLPIVAAYHSPERVAGEQISQSDDTWALAVTLYVSLTGRLPFSGATEEELRQKILAAEPAPLAGFGLQEESLQRVLDRAFARDRSERIALVGVLRTALEEAKPNTKLARLLPLDDDEDGDEDDDKTIVRPSLRGVTPQHGVPIKANPGPAAGPPAPNLNVRGASPPQRSPEERSSMSLATLKRTIPMNELVALPPMPPPPAPSAPGQPVESQSAPSRHYVMPGQGQVPGVESPSSPSWQLGPASTPYPPGSSPGPQVQPPILPGAPPRRAGANKIWLVPAAAFGALLLTAAVLFVGPALRGRGRLGPPSEAAASGATSAPSAESPPPETPPASDNAAAPVVPQPDPNACMRPLFAADTFEPDQTPQLDFVCTETDVRKGGQAIRAEVVRTSGQKRVSEGMREWAVLGWYEMAAFVAMRARCCPSAAPIEVPAAVGGCPTLSDSLDSIAKAAVPGTEEAKVDEALDGYTRAVRCIIGTGTTTGYPKPQGGEDTALKKTLVRAAAP